MFERFPKAKVVVHPHGTAIIPGQKYNHPRRFNEWDKVGYRHDLSILHIPEEFPWTFDRVPNAKLSAVGFPPHDPWWMEKLIRRADLRESVEAKAAQGKERVILYISRGPSKNFFQNSFEYITRSVADAVLSDPRNFLLIKPHPLYPIEVIKTFFEPYPSDRWMMTGLHPVQAAGLSDFVLSVWSSCVMDSIALGKPVVEVYQYLNPMSQIVGDELDRNTSFMRLTGIVPAANSKEDIEGYLSNYFDPQADHTIWKAQQQRLHSLRVRSENESSVAARRVFALIDPERYEDGNATHNL